LPRPNASAVPGESEDAAAAVTPEIGAEASVWIARLHGPDRSRHMERECLAWQALSVAHRIAFERCTDTWQDVGRVTLSSYASATGTASGRAAAERRPWPRRRVRRSFALALATLAMAGLVAVQPWRAIDTYSTGVGEQQMVLLRDGTRMSLNTATRVRVELSASQRTVNIDGGEVLFEVAKDARRPFVVRAAGSEVVAVGTVFSVRMLRDNGRVDDALAVTLIEGQVSFRTAAHGAADGAAPAQPLLLQPGDRVRFGEVVDASSNGVRRATTRVDRPRIEQVMAWKRNEAVFDDVSLADAVAEMNRYSRIPILLVGDETLTRRRVSGLFRVGDNVAFARAVAALHSLVLRERQHRLELGPD
jgi:transmembrane sensor